MQQTGDLQFIANSTRTHARMHAHMQACMHTRMQACTYAHAHTQTFMNFF